MCSGTKNQHRQVIQLALTNAAKREPAGLNSRTTMHFTYASCACCGSMGAQEASNHH
jgi:hypothetical protein